jgi:hypothetical protein
MKKSTSASKLLHTLVVKPNIPPQASAIEEWSNAISMIVPSLVALWFIRQPEHNSELLPRIQCAGTLLHFPFSFLWHASSAISRPQAILKRLDISFIHMSGVIISLSVSGSLLWTSVNLAWTFYSTFMLWTQTDGEMEGNQKAARSQRIIITVVLYTLPVLYNGLTLVYMASLSSFIISGTFYQVYPHGFGHTLFHVLMGIFQYFMINAASLIEAQGKGSELQFLDFLKQI